MKLPNRENAYIPLSKLLNYVLSNTHFIGKWKARFFRTFGFDETNVDVLAQRLTAIARSEEVKEVVPSPYGVKYVLDGLLETPAGDIVTIRTVWILETDDDRPRFVTAYPA